MTMLNEGIDAAELGRITRSCRRWNGIDSLPATIRDKLEELDYLSQRLLDQTADRDVDFALMLVPIKNNCLALKREFAKIQVSFDCPSCPLRAD
ncbi:MAG: hypothetical protein D4R84_06545 [Rhodocyclaceae bacterium]|nr:MAG: hypothetical protein D4R84_06545 [Rhodocyclaceae bacterium]